MAERWTSICGERKSDEMGFRRVNHFGESVASLPRLLTMDGKIHYCGKVLKARGFAVVMLCHLLAIGRRSINGSGRKCTCEGCGFSRYRVLNTR